MNYTSSQIANMSADELRKLAGIAESVGCDSCISCISCKDCNNCYSCDYCNNCKDCDDCKYCKYCINCNFCDDCDDCYKCSSLTNKSYCFMNVQLTQKQYFDAMKKLGL